MLDALARWAAELRAQDVPSEVMAQARLLHLSLAGALRRAGAHPTARKVLENAGAGPILVLGTGRRFTAKDAARAHAAMAASQDFADTVFNSPAPLGAICAAWSGSPGHTLDELLLATVAGIEVAARVGAAALLAKTQGDAWGPVHALSAAVTTGKLAGLDAARLGHAMALALSGATVIPRERLFGDALPRGVAVSEQVLIGVESALQAQKGATGPMDVLERRTFEAMECPLPLRAALDGAGKVWLSQAALFKPIPGCMAAQVPVQAVQEILRRHVKAAEKRLRTDQVERITLRVAAPGWASEQLTAEGWDPGRVTRSIARSVAALITAYELGSPQLDPAWLEQQREVLVDLAQRVEVSHAWAFTVAGTIHLAEVAGPLFSGVSARALAQALRAQGGAWPQLPLPYRPAELLELAKVHPERLLLARADGVFNPSAWRCPQRVEVKLYTSRGGWWPERRENPDGAGWPWERVVQMVEAKWAGDGPGPGAMSIAGSEPGEAWLTALSG